MAYLCGMFTIEQARAYIHASIAHLYASDECRFLALDLLGDILSLSRSQLLLAHPQRCLSLEEEQIMLSSVERLQQGEPIQYILGWVEFADLHLSVGKGVLIPRPETEELVARILRDLEGKSAPTYMDIGTGSGCIALALAHGLPQSIGYAVEKSPDAYRIAQGNREKLYQAGLIAPLHLIEGDLFAPEEWIGQVRHEIGIVVSNPPYIQPHEASDMARHVLESEPAMALFAPKNDPLHFYEGIAQLCHRLPLAPNARIYLEINALLGEETRTLFAADSLFKEVELIQDLSGRDRFVCAQIVR